MNMNRIAGLVALTAMSVMTPEVAQADETVCKGQSINILMESVPDTDAVLGLKQEFESKYGLRSTSRRSIIR